MKHSHHTKLCICNHLLKFSIGVKLPRFFRLLKADQLNLIDQGLVRTHAFVDVSVLPKPILMLHCDLSHLVFLSGEGGVNKIDNLDLDDLLVLQKVASEAKPKVYNHGEGPY